MQRTVTWRALGWEGIEHLSLDVSEERTVADGLILAVLERRPLRVWYRVWLDAGGVARQRYTLLERLAGGARYRFESVDRDSRLTSRSIATHWWSRTPSCSSGCGSVRVVAWGQPG